MRLLQWTSRGFKFTKDFLPDDKIPNYAILSHRWGRDDEEVKYKDICDGVGKNKAGYEKLKFCAERAKKDHLQHFWVDTCCIDKSSQSELQEAITSMFRWYRNSTRCYVYMPDISISVSTIEQFNIERDDAFRNHSWFTRGWTLQELIAPTSVEFFAKDGLWLGDKSTLGTQIEEITGIPISLLQGTSDLSSFDTEERFRWTEKRQTTRGEDLAYCLLGIFGISIWINYGEGKEEATRRLKAKVSKSKQHYDKWRERENRIWQVPFERNPCFTGRTAELEYIRRQLFTQHRTAKVVITGLGGIGKTNLVIELLFRLREEYQDCSFLWIPATTDESVSQAYRKAAQELRIPGWDDKEADVKQLVQDHLNSKDAGRTVLVFDNADDINIWVRRATPKARRLLDYLPKGDHVSILVTTRNKELAFKLISSPQCLVELPDVGERDGRELFRKLLIDQDLLNNEDDVVTLLQWLTYLPLAIVQASMYINHNACDLQNYLSLLDQQEEHVVELLSYDFEDHGRRDSDGKNPIATTWLISFAQIRERDPLAADYLSFMACVDTKDIPQSLLPPGPSRKTETDALGTLKGYSFITKQSADAAINIHRLVHLATRNWLLKEGLLPSWIGRATVRLADVLAEAGSGNRVVWRTYMPHAYYTLGSVLTSDDDEDKVILLNRYGLCLFYDGRYNEAEILFQRVIKTCKTKLGVDHPDTLTSMANLASTYRNQGRWDEAEKLQVQVIEARKTKLGVDHPDTLTSMADLALTYWNQGRWDEAEKLQVQVIEARKTKFGVDHPDTLASMANLTSTYRNQGRWDEAEKLEVQVIEGYKTKLGVDHPDTLITMGSHASTYRNQGRWDEAEKLEVQVIEGCKTKLGVDHPDTLIIMGNLALTYWNQGRWDEAEKLGVQVMEARKTKLGVDHRDTLTSISNLALIYWDQGRRDEAEKLEVQVMEARKTKLGVDHPDTLTSMANLTSTYRNQGRWDEAEKLEVQVIEGYKTKLGVDHPDTLTIISSYASTYRYQGRWDEAEKLQVQVMEARKTKLGVDHPDTLTSMADLALTYWNQGRWDEAEKLQVQVIEARKTKLGVDHPDTLTSMGSLAFTWRNQGRYEEALALMKDCALARQRRLGPEHPDTVLSFTFIEDWS